LGTLVSSWKPALRSSWLRSASSRLYVAISPQQCSCSSCAHPARRASGACSVPCRRRHHRLLCHVHLAGEVSMCGQQYLRGLRACSCARGSICLQDPSLQRTVKRKKRSAGARRHALPWLWGHAMSAAAGGKRACSLSLTISLFSPRRLHAARSRPSSASMLSLWNCSTSALRRRPCPPGLAYQSRAALVPQSHSAQT